MPSLNTPEKIASLYLRLNGFLQLPLFTLFYEDRYGQIDLLALRAGGSVEKAMGVSFPVDDQFFETCKCDGLPTPKATTFGVVAEVRGNQNRKSPAVDHAQYASGFLGGTPVIRVSFVDAVKETGVKHGVVIVGLKYADAWIENRLQWMEAQGWQFTKSGSWSLSEGYLESRLYELGRDWESPSEADEE